MRMRKTGWRALGIAGLSLLMCAPARAQTAGPAERAGEPRTQPPLEANPGPAAPSAPRAAGGEVELERSVVRLQWDVAQLRAEVSELRAQLAEARGVGGAGGQAGTGGSGTAAPDDEVRGTSEATALYSGTVQEVGPQAIVIGDETGSLLTLDVDRNTRVLRDGRRIALGQLQEGTRVRASVDLLSDGRNEAVEILVQPLGEGGAR
jgi:hypothetical protein